MSGMGVLGLFLGEFSGRDNSPPPAELKWFILMIWIVVTAFLYWSCVRLKKVRVDASAIYVSNYLKEIRIPFEAIAEVSENRWLNIHPVTIYVRSRSPFGDQVVFMPKMRFFCWTSHL